MNIIQLQELVNTLNKSGVNLHKIMRVLNIVTNSSTNDIAKKSHLSLSMVNAVMRGHKRMTTNLQTAIIAQYGIDIVKMYHQDNINRET